MTRKGTRRYRLACFDLDGTLVDDTIFIWQTLHDHFGSDATRRRHARENLPLQQIALVGDHETDLEVVRLLKAQGGMAVAFNCKSPALAREASVVVPGRDLRAVLPHLLQD